MNAESNHVDPAFLQATEIIDFGCPEVAALAARLQDKDETSTTRNCFHYVRDEIQHSGDHRLNPVTCSASEVLRHRTGYCYAKSHLLCALIRANGIPSGLCYQRLSVDGVAAPFCLHGMTAAFLPEFGWYRMDARGNRSGIDARFTPPVERLAFSTQIEGEYDLDRILPSPLEDVAKALTSYFTWDELGRNLPDHSDESNHDHDATRDRYSP